MILNGPHDDELGTWQADSSWTPKPVGTGD